MVLDGGNVGFYPPDGDGAINPSKSRRPDKASFG